MLPACPAVTQGLKVLEETEQRSRKGTQRPWQLMRAMSAARWKSLFPLLLEQCEFADHTKLFCLCLCCSIGMCFGTHIHSSPGHWPGVLKMFKQILDVKGLQAGSINNEILKAPRSKKLQIPKPSELLHDTTNKKFHICHHAIEAVKIQAH